MVSKVAVIALVAIVACPILMGFAMNISEQTITVYENDNDPVNVSQLLQNGIIYSNTHIDVYQMNRLDNMSSLNAPVIPVYENVTKTYSSYPLAKSILTSGTFPNTTFRFGNYTDLYLQSNYTGSGATITLTVYDQNNNVVQTVNNMFTFNYRSSESTVYVSYFNDLVNLTTSSLLITIADSNYTCIFTHGSPYTATGYWEYAYTDINNVNTRYIDFTAGFHFEGFNKYYVSLPDHTYSYLLTVNLDSVPGTDWRIRMLLGALYDDQYDLIKTTTGGVASYSLVRVTDSAVIFDDLYYDPNRSDNTYQIYLTFENTAEINGDYYYDSHLEFRYIGGWPSNFGVANYYQKYTHEHTQIYGYGPDNVYLSGYYFYLDLPNSPSRSFTMRFDDALSRGYEIPVIENNEYKPADFRTNPSTILSNLEYLGSSITFGGTTYSVSSDGNITMGTHQVSLRNIIFDSVPNGLSYDNRINGTVVSTTADPSSITFNGKWIVNVTTTGQTPTTGTTTEWTPGQFAWDGLDSNFLMVGLMTSFGAFIALAIYSRRSRVSLWPLMLICGGAAALFLFML